MSQSTYSRASRRLSLSGAASTCSSDEGAYIAPVKIITPAPVVVQAHGEWQKLRYNRRSAAASSPSASSANSSANSTPAGGPRSPAMAPVPMSAALPPRPSFLNWSAASAPVAQQPQASSPSRTYVSPLAEWALRKD